MNSYLKEACKIGLSAAKKNAVPGVFLQLLALALIISYYLQPSIKGALDKVGEFNTAWDPWFAIILTMTFGGVIPLIIEGVRDKRAGEGGKTPAQVLFTLLLWAFSGLIATLFYSFQARMFGDDSAFLTIFMKVCVDQFIYVPLYVVPVFTVFLLWRDLHFSCKSLKEAFQKKSFLSRAVPLMISNWIIWIPVASIMYAFPLSLQLILMNLILVFWSLILAFFVSE